MTTILLAFFLVLQAGITQAADGGGPPAARVAILPFAMNAPAELGYLRDGVRDMLASRLAAGDGVRLVERARVEAAMAGRPQPASDGDFRDLAASLGADYVAAGSLTALGGGVSVDARVYPAAADKPVERFFATAPRDSEVIAAVDGLAWDIGERLFGRQRPAAPAVPATATTTSGPTMTMHPDRMYRQSMGTGGSVFIRPTGIAGTAEFVKSQTLDFELAAMDAGDVDGDGALEIVCVSRSELLVYRHEGGRRLKLFWRVPGQTSFPLHGVSLADLDRDGRAEIYVSAADPEEPHSWAVQWRGQDFGYLFQDIPWYIRAVDLPGEGRTLVGQRAGVGAADSTAGGSRQAMVPGLFRLTISGGNVQEAGRLSVPDSVNVFDFVMADLDGDGSSEVVAVDRSNRLRVWRADGKALWASDEHFGGTTRFIAGGKPLDRSLREDALPPDRIYLPSRLLVADVNNDRQPDVIVNRNPGSASQIFENYKSYPSGEIYALSWNGLALAELWHTRKIDGEVVDYQLRAGKEGEPALLVVGLILGGGLLESLAEGESAVVTYQLDLSGAVAQAEQGR
ncbi:MAG: FG-GAP-like repeat-containing protein [Thermodesulfobacteriota bacterium]